ncbi:PREDICTED: uncharacterized protein LOC109227921 [Nicotiana attenuata]|uniref:uncharacterized protein LOC109227921 n=1 Tax=Nicotiana attenuata TaxID=49451 RepID=UPI000904D395|nr:PREDICTED: uncharacterized protein LOC109227921 [Nicotiana attenuata]
MASITHLQQCLNHFYGASGLRANQEKSSIFFRGVTHLASEEIVQKFGYSRGELPVKYLGVLLSTKKMSIAQWQPLIEKMVARISSWTAKKLSYAGRIQLVQSVLFGIQAYWSQLFLIPSKVLKTIETYFRSYVWLGENVITRRSLVAWDKICTPKSAGGLNLINLKVWNRAATAKNYWDLAHKCDKMWIKWIHAYYIKGQQISDMPIPQQASWLVRKVVEARSLAEAIQIQTRNNKSMIRQIYYKMVGQLPRVEWKVDTKCVLCQSCDESRNHMFVECEFARSIWKRLLKRMQRQSFWATSWDQHWKWAIENAKGKSSRAAIFKMVYVEAIHTIWNERNLRIFEKQSREAEELARNVACICNVRATDQTRTCSNLNFD